MRSKYLGDRYGKKDSVIQAFGVQYSLDIFYVETTDKHRWQASSALQ